MAPEWTTNSAITSKVDVYSYGVVVLEMVTGENPGYKRCCHLGKGEEKRGTDIRIMDRRNR